ncbi:DUF4476 domain-containing protein [Solitalea canadensis]|uniref:DUF4476 domain-containing protein n=1 Tax=Solitalea canadensis (strain ATCC 29591 / DSM 3403 / JCM 21819 / LMG 8368 / NBRC 15130 / NCIMB 12057 / USAM 9D) TaxID=929556 RepID=H8KXB4_SOLCM|nr:DUF4476 domain-containing protein [Solitalea canadensis]AFD08443.1 hypothetical protein Solca_3438 [Solitalea canadensis DSM 3403]
MNSNYLKITVALFLSFISINTFAFNQTVTVSLSNRESIIVEIDGRVQNSRPQRQVIISSMNQGVHSLKVYRSSSNSSRPVAINNQKVLYTGNFYLNNNRSMAVTIDNWGRASFVEVDTRSNNNDNYDRYPDNDYDRYPNSNYHDCIPMTSGEFDQLKNSLKDRSFDDKKMDLLKVVINNNYFSTNQVKEIVKLFSFNNNQLNAAKLLYPYTVDQEYYYTVGDAFTFSSSKNDLDKFLATQSQNRK